MVNLPPESEEQRRRDRVLTFDEMVALVVAFLAIGGILFWGLGRTTRGLGALRSTGVSDVVNNERGFWDDQIDRILPAPATTDVEPEQRPFQRARTPRSAETRGGSNVLPNNEAVRRTPLTTGSRYVPPAVVDPEATTPPLSEEATPLSEEASPTPMAGDVAETPPPLDISDVPEDYWAYPFISTLYERGRLPDFPEGQFQPDKELTRAELAALVESAFLEDVPPPTSSGFTDVSPTYWASDAIGKAVETGFVSGYPEGDFRPDQPVPRYQVLITLASGLGLTPAEDPGPVLQRFNDADQVPEWARGQVAKATSEGLVVNYPDVNTLAPNQTATRAEIVAMIYQSLVAAGNAEPIESPYVVQP